MLTIFKEIFTWWNRQTLGTRIQIFFFEILELLMKSPIGAIKRYLKCGKLSYTNDSITYNGEVYERLGGMIKYNGEWHTEGSDAFPWERH